MAWIETIDETNARGKLALIYERMRGPRGTRVANILKSQSLDPHSLAAHHAFYRSVMSGSKTLPRADREMIAVTVSRINGCHY